MTRISESLVVLANCAVCATQPISGLNSVRSGERLLVQSQTRDPAGPLPLIVGVTGHIDLTADAQEAVRDTVRTLLAGLRSAYPNTPIKVVTALAQGADQLVASEARALSLPLVAVLPMPLAEYQKTIQSTEARERLLELWEQAELRIELPRVGELSKGNDDAFQYEQAGLVISHVSHVMLALWNGAGAWDPHAPETERKKQQGGTAHVIYLREAGDAESTVPGISPLFPLVHTRLYPVDRGLTFRIAAPRNETDDCVGEAGSLWLRYPEKPEEEIAATGKDHAKNVRLAIELLLARTKKEASGPVDGAKVELEKLDKANSLLSAIARNNPGAVAHSEQRMLPDFLLANLATQRDAALVIRQAYALADVFSRTNQRRVHLAILYIVLVLLAAVLTYELFAHAHTYIDARKMLFFYLIVVLVPVAIHWTVIRRLEWQNRFQDFRALAEALRVQLFWGLAGISCGVTDFYLRKHQDEMSWIRLSLRGAALQGLAMGLGEVHRELVTTHWIEDQFHYFSGTDSPTEPQPGKANLNEKRRQQFDLWASIAYGAGIVDAIVLLIVLTRGMPVGEGFETFAIIFMGFAPALAGALSIISEKRAYKDHAHQYSRMGRTFGKALKLISRLELSANRDFTMIVRDLGAEALAENGDWLMAHRDRQVEPIKGG
jgi:hypothetical protein